MKKANNRRIVYTTFIVFMMFIAQNLLAIETYITQRIREQVIEQAQSAKETGSRADLGPFVNTPLFNLKFDGIPMQGASMRAVVGGRNFSGADLDTAQIPFSTLNGLGLTPLFHDGGEWPNSGGDTSTDSGSGGFLAGNLQEAIYDVDGNNHYPKAVLRYIGTHCYIFVPVMYFPTLPRNVSSSEDWTPPAKAEWGKYWPDSAAFSNGPYFYAPDSVGSVLEPRFVLGATKEQARESLRKLADNFDSIIYPKIREYYGNEPDIDGDPKIFILLDDIRDGLGSFQGYFWAANQFARSSQPMSNEKELIYVDLFPNFVMDQTGTYRTLAHEFTHMIIFNENYKIVDGQLLGMERWLEEGLTTFSEHIFDGSFNPNLDAFIRNPDTILADNRVDEVWLGSSPYANYGASFLWIYYLVEKYGASNVPAFLKNIVRHQAGNMETIDAVLKAHGTDASTAFRDWALANYLDQTHRRDGSTLNDGKWGYKIDNDNNSSNYVGVGNTERLPVRFSEKVLLRDDITARSANVNPWAADYIEISGNTGNLNLGFEGDSKANFQVALIKKGWEVDPAVEFFYLDQKQAGNMIIKNYGAGNTYSNLILVPLVTSNMSFKKVNYAYSASFNDLKVAVFPNPVYENHLHVVVRTLDKFIAEPRVKITFEGEQGYLVMSPVDSSTYISTYSLERSGEGTLEATGTSTNGLVLSNLLKFSAVYYPPNSQGFLNASFVSLNIPANSISRGGVVLVATVENPTSYDGLMRLSNDYDLALPVEKTEKPLELYLNIDNLDSSRTSKAGLYMVAGDEPKWLSSVIIDEKIARANVDTSGRLFVGLDEIPPEISDSLTTLDNGHYAVAVKDNGSGINPESVSVSYRGTVIPSMYDEEGIIKLNTSSLMDGEYPLVIEVADRAGNKSLRQIRGFVAGPDALKQISVFPNPARTHSVIQAAFTGPGKDTASVDAKIYDLRGDKVTNIDLSRRASGLYQARWDLRNAAGKQVANGVYYLEVRVELNGATHKERHKIAVLR